MTRRFSLALFVVFSVAAWGCGDDETVQETTKRGVAGGSKKSAKKDGKAKAKAKGSGADGDVAEGEELEEEGPKRPTPVLTREDFANRRDPFQSFVGSQVVELEPDRPRAQRKVRMSEYSFEDLKLIAIVNSGRRIVPRALFLASDGKSKTIRQGEYFSRAEVLLAAVNRDYVEIEVVDEELAQSLNLKRGERRAIYLRNE